MGPMNENAPLHVVFGAGQVGLGLAARLAAKGLRVRVVKRSTVELPGVEVLAGDATDVAFATRACAGAAVVYHCMNPSAYTGAAWADEFPRQGEALIAATLAAGARLVCLDNLYGYGVVEGERTEATPLGAEGPKGRVRVAWARRLEAARDAEGLRFVVGRAGDFFGPGTADNSLFSTAALRKMAAGSAMWLVGDADAPHSFSFVPDVVAGLAAVGEAGAEVEGRFLHLPMVTMSPRALVTAIASAAGVRPRAYALPAWLLVGLSPAVPLFRELRETLYQWDRPFLASDAAFRALFSGLAAGADRAAAETAALLRPEARPAEGVGAA